MRAFFKVTDADGAASTEVWSRGEWLPIDPEGFDWRAHEVAYADEPRYDIDGLLCIGEGFKYSKDPEPAPLIVRVMLAAISSLPALAEVIPGLVGDADATVDMALSEGVNLKGRLADLRSFAETGTLEDRMVATADAHHARLLAVVDGLRTAPHASQLRVFGSAAAGKELPGDIDVYADCSGLTDKETNELAVYLIRLAKTHYGMLDPFLLLGNRLHVRDDAARGWTAAKHAKAIKAAGESGVPLAEFAMKTRILDRFRSEPPAAAPASPSMAR